MTTFGIDVSRWQGDVDFKKVAAEGYKFVIAKCSQGATARDPKFEQNYTTAKLNGLLFAAYHYVTKENALQQAALVKAIIRDRDIPVMLDWEDGSGTYGNFLDVLTKCRAAGIRVVMSYIPRWYWEQQGKPTISNGTLLVSSRYPSAGAGNAAALYDKVTDKHWESYGGIAPAILQFSDNGTVAGARIDLNAFKGTIEELSRIWYPVSKEEEWLMAEHGSYCETVAGKKRIVIAIPAGAYKEVTFAAGFSDVVLDNIWVIGVTANQPNYLNHYTGYLIRKDNPTTTALPPNAKQITIEYAGGNSFGWVLT